jgi:catechol 2,3-dioxygenase-like lactoylglutathione lyase family enzyme
MPATFDHVTICVTDVDDALCFFGVLGFEVVKRVVATGPTMDAYMGLDDMRADHVTLAIPGAEPYQEVQLLRFDSPTVEIDAGSGFLARTGLNHFCFRVDDIAATLQAFVDAGFEARNELMHFNERDLVFLRGPANVVVELAQWT